MFLLENYVFSPGLLIGIVNENDLHRILQRKVTPSPKTPPSPTPLIISPPIVTNAICMRRSSQPY